MWVSFELNQFLYLIIFGPLNNFAEESYFLSIQNHEISRILVLIPDTRMSRGKMSIPNDMANPWECWGGSEPNIREEMNQIG